MVEASCAILEIASNHPQPYSTCIAARLSIANVPKLYKVIEMAVSHVSL
jgi:hypothetical protein